MHRAAALFVLLLVAGCGSSSSSGPGSLLVVANRGDGTISVIDAQSMTVIDTVALPSATNASVPGYVTYSAAHDRLYVGDEANQRVVVFAAGDFAHIADLPALGDVFHIWQNGTQLWAVDRTSRGVAVFDLATNTRITFLPIPGDLEASGGVPHDVVVDADHAYVSIVGVTDAPDVVVRYRTDTLAEAGRMLVGEDPHLFLHPTTSRLYVACQDSDAVYVFDRQTLAEEDVIPADGGHGIWIPPHGRTLYVTNFAGHEVGTPDPDGPFALISIDLSTNEVFDATHSSYSAPHNIASDAAGTRLFITHSNGARNVTAYSAFSPRTGPREIGTIEVGTNPFGICLIR